MSAAPKIYYTGSPIPTTTTGQAGSPRCDIDSSLGCGGPAQPQQGIWRATARPQKVTARRRCDHATRNTPTYIF